MTNIDETSDDFFGKVSGDGFEIGNIIMKMDECYKKEKGKIESSIENLRTFLKNNLKENINDKKKIDVSFNELEKILASSSMNDNDFKILRNVKKSLDDKLKAVEILGIDPQYNGHDGSHSKKLSDENSAAYRKDIMYKRLKKLLNEFQDTSDKFVPDEIKGYRITEKRKMNIQRKLDDFSKCFADEFNKNIVNFVSEITKRKTGYKSFVEDLIRAFEPYYPIINLVRQFHISKLDYNPDSRKDYFESMYDMVYRVSRSELKYYIKQKCKFDPRKLRNNATKKSGADQLPFQLDFKTVEDSTIVEIRNFFGEELPGLIILFICTMEKFYESGNKDDYRNNYYEKFHAKYNNIIVQETKDIIKDVLDESYNVDNKLAALCYYYFGNPNTLLPMLKSELNIDSNENILKNILSNVLRDWDFVRIKYFKFREIQKNLVEETKFNKKKTSVLIPVHSFVTFIDLYKRDGRKPYLVDFIIYSLEVLYNWIVKDVKAVLGKEEKKYIRITGLNIFRLAYYIKELQIVEEASEIMEKYCKTIDDMKNKIMCYVLKESLKDAYSFFDQIETWTTVYGLSYSMIDVQYTHTRAKFTSLSEFVRKKIVDVIDFCFSHINQKFRENKKESFGFDKEMMEYLVQNLPKFFKRWDTLSENCYGRKLILIERKEIDDSQNSLTQYYTIEELVNSRSKKFIKN